MNHSTCDCECDRHSAIDEYLKNCTDEKSIIDGLVTICDEILDTSETMSINSNDKKGTYKMDYYIVHTFLFVTIVTILALIIVTICIKHLSKAKELLPY